MFVILLHFWNAGQTALLFFTLKQHLFKTKQQFTDNSCVFPGNKICALMCGRRLWKRFPASSGFWVMGAAFQFPTGYIKARTLKTLRRHLLLLVTWHPVRQQVWPGEEEEKITVTLQFLCFEKQKSLPFSGITKVRGHMLKPKLRVIASLFITTSLFKLKVFFCRSVMALPLCPCLHQLDSTHISHRKNTHSHKHVTAVVCEACKRHPENELQPFSGLSLP